MLPYFIQDLAEKDTKKSLELLKQTLTQEIQRLKNQQKYYQKTYSTNVDQDIFNLALETKFGDLDKQIETLKNVRSQIMRRKKGEDIKPQYYKLFNLRKEQKNIEKQNKQNKQNFRQIIAIIGDEKVQETFYRMFFKGQFLGLNESSLAKFDLLFNKLGLGLTDYIKKAIKKEYSAWASDVAYEYIDEWISETQSEMIKADNLTEVEQDQMIELLNILKNNMGY